MENWWNQRYFDKRNWILENLQKLNLSMAEALVLLLIDYFNEYQIDLSLNILSEKCQVSVEEIDNMINSLHTKGYLDVKVLNKKISFSLDGLFEEKDQSNYDTASLYELFESELGRILTQSELSKLNAWLQTYDVDEIINALREALIYKKKDFNYIQRILLNKQQENKE
ncbi:hypothetical protein SDC9_155446 [bioreactor metagenome]|uniref:DnaB/C C-terminal domain-containing protein n=1 Tax=bioreactor metagenome TaxID=1076179 RepID=A0A645F3F2_9ZZZZ|nr:DnaD domain protein [Erysipelotrichaceae bacterium]